MCMARESRSFFLTLLGLYPDSGSGYKIFLKEKDGSLKSPVFLSSGVKPEGEWITDTNPGSYRDAGFHTYLRLEDARKAYDRFTGYEFVIRRVRYRNAVAYGRGDGMDQPKAKIVVARSLYIEPGN